MFGGRRKALESEIAFGDTLDRVSRVLAQIEPVRIVLRRIERESRDEHSREHAAAALQLLEVGYAR